MEEKQQLKGRLIDYLSRKGITFSNANPPVLRCINPDHRDSHPSAVIYQTSRGDRTDTVYCPVCDQNWDIFSAASLLTGLDTKSQFPEIIEEINSSLGIYSPDPSKKKTSIETKPVTVKELSLEEGRAIFKPSAVLEYCQKIDKSAVSIEDVTPYMSESGLLRLIESRCRTESGSKTVLSLYYDGKRISSKQYPICLYNADKFQSDDRPILINEGGRCAKIAEKQLSGFLCTGWNGGGKKARMAPWNLISGKTVYIFPDDDQKTDPDGNILPDYKQPGYSSAVTVYEILKKNNTVRIVRPILASREIKPDGADVVEALQVMTPEELTDHILKNNFQIEDPETDEPATEEDTGITSLESLYFENPTNFAGAKVFLEQNKGRYIFEPTDAKGGGIFWEIKNGCYYEPVLDIRSRIAEALGETTDRIYAYLKERPGQNMRGLHVAMARVVSKGESRGFCGGVADFFGELVTVKNIEWNVTPEVFCCQDFLVDFSGTEIETRLPELGLEFFRDPLPYSAKEIMISGQPVKFMAFLSSLFPDESTAEMARMTVAAGLSGRGGKNICLHYNSAGNGGKNTFFDILREAFPGAVFNASAATITVSGDSSERRFDLYRWRGKRLPVIDEVTKEFDVAALKYLSSGSFIRGEAKGKDAIEFPQTWVLNILTNRLPKFRPADDSAFLNRLVVLPYNSVFFESEEQRLALINRGVNPEKLHPARSHEDILDELRPEFCAIVRTVAEDSIMLREMFNGKIPESIEAERARSVYVSQNDTVESFIRSCLKTGDYERATNTELTDAWQDFTGDEKMTSAKLGILLKERLPGLVSNKVNGIRGIKGISVIHAE